MTVTLVLADSLERDLTVSLENPLETAAVLLVRRFEGPTGIRLLGRSVHWVTDSDYLKRSATAMTIVPEGYVPALAAAELDGAIPIWFHTHPGRNANPRPSAFDTIVDDNIADLFRLRGGSELYGTLIFAHGQEGRFNFTGKIDDGRGGFQAIDRVWSVGSDWRLTLNAEARCAVPPSIFDRNIRAFGADIQAVLSDLTIAVVGAGGTGSAAAEQLVRLGVRKLILLDADHLSASNVTRVYGSTPEDVKVPKVDILAKHLRRIAPELECRPITGMITREDNARLLCDADVIFGCTDDNAGRLVLSRLSTFFLVPVIDVGVLLSSDVYGRLTGIDGRITTMTPGAACLGCRGRIDLGRAAAEQMSPNERQRLADEGYAPALGGIEPAVIAFTTAVAAGAVNELLDRLIGYGPPARPTETLLRIHERETSTNHAAPRDCHYCHPSQGKWGAGGESPFLDQLWP